MNQNAAFLLAVVLLAGAGGCESKGTATQSVEFFPTGGTFNPERIDESMQEAYDAIDWDLVLADALKSEEVSASGWQPPAEMQPAEGLAAAIEHERTPGSSFIEITASAPNEAQAQILCQAVVDAFRKRYARGVPVGR